MGRRETTVEQDVGACVMTNDENGTLGHALGYQVAAETVTIACPECAGEGTVPVSRVRSMRITLGLSTHRLAELLGVSLRTLQRWEAGQEPRALYMQKLEQMLKEHDATQSQE